MGNDTAAIDVKDTLRIGLLSPVDNLDPVHAQFFMEELIGSQIYDTPFAHPKSAGMPTEPGVLAESLREQTLVQTSLGHVLLRELENTEFPFCLQGIRAGNLALLYFREVSVRKPELLIEQFCRGVDPDLRFDWIHTFVPSMQANGFARFGMDFVRG